MRITRFIVAAGLIAAAQCAFAQTLYKLIDRNGKVTYSEEKPKEFDGQVIPMTIDPNANTATLPKANFNDPTKKAAAGALVKAAQERLDKAKAELKSAKDNPAEGEKLMVGKVGGGVRTIDSDDYRQKLNQLEQNVKDAEDNLARAEKGG